MITIFQLIAQTITPGQSNRFDSLHKKLGTKDMTQVFVLIAIHEGYNTKDAISALREHKSNKHNLLRCEKTGLLEWELGQSPHDKRARMKIYKLTPKAELLVQSWMPTLCTLLERTNHAMMQHKSQH